MVPMLRMLSVLVLISGSLSCRGCSGDVTGRRSKIQPAFSTAACTPEVLADEIDFPDQIAVDATDVYVLARQRIYRLPKTGGKPAEVAADLGDKGGFAVDNGVLYAGAGAKLYAITGTQKVVVADVTEAYKIASDATQLYITTGAGKDARVLSVPRAGGTVRTLVDHLDFTSDVAVDGNDVVFVEYDKNRIGRVPKVGGPPTWIVSTSTTLQGMAVEHGDVVWSALGTHSLLLHETDSGQLSYAGGYDVALRDGVVYWGEAMADGGVYRAHVEAGPAQKMCPSPNRIEAITTDENYVYWAERGAMSPGGLLQSASGRVLRAPR